MYRSQRQTPSPASPLPSLKTLALMVVIGLALKVIYARLPGDPNDKDFWELMRLRKDHQNDAT